MSKKQEGTYRLAGGITVTDADLEADAQRFEAGECDGSWKVLPGRPQLFGEDTMPVGTRLPESLVRELDEAAGELRQTRSELVRRFISDGLLALKAQKLHKAVGISCRNAQEIPTDAAAALSAERPTLSGLDLP